MNVPPTNADHRLDPEEIFAGIDFDRLTAVVVAVSGGSDSLALLFLLDDLRRSRGAFPRIVAVTVDHGLRAESAEEALYVADLCKAAGLDHHIVNWAGAKPATGLSAKAREARYRLLRDAAGEAATDVILTGHTLDDQNETFMMRAARGGERGLAGMARFTLLERATWLVRPLLGIRREDLRGYLRARRIVWRDDPSNANPQSERVQVRTALQEQGSGDIPARVARNGAQRLAVNSEAAKLLLGHVTVTDGVRAEVNTAGFDQYGDAAQRLAMGVLLAAMGGLSFLPSVQECGKAVRHLTGADDPRRMSLGRCIIQRVKTGVTIYREMRSIPDAVIAPGCSIVWDGRYRVSNGAPIALRIRAAGDDGVVFLQESGCGNVHRASIASSPALVVEGRIVAVPALPYPGPHHGNVPAGVEVTRHVALFDHILSGYDENLAASVAKLFGLRDYKRFSVNQIDKN
jgi:tRNA(Ile)-lysidine synthase